MQQTESAPATGELRALLDAAGAVWHDGLVVRFADPRAEADAALGGDVVAYLGHLGHLLARGPEADSFLQGQLTVDVREVTPRRSRIAAWCTPKGRVIAIARLLREDDGLRLQIPTTLAARALDRLRLYVLRARVTLEDSRERLTGLGLAGPRAEAWIGTRIGRLPETADDVVRDGALAVVRAHGPPPRLEVIGPVAALAELWREALGHARPVGASAWSLLEVMAGVPSVSPVTSEAFLPQMLNLDHLGAISFTKGCYVGQEVVARTQHLGRLKRRTYLARARAEAAPREGDPLYTGTGEGGQAAGTVLNVALHADGSWRLLAVIQHDAAHDETLYLRHVLGDPLELLPLPYRAQPLDA